MLFHQLLKEREKRTFHLLFITVVLNNAMLFHQLVQEGKVRVGVIVLCELFSLEDVAEPIGV